MKKIIISVMIALAVSIFLTIYCYNMQSESNEELIKYANFIAASYEGDTANYENPDWKKIPDFNCSQKMEEIEKNRSYILKVTVQTDDYYCRMVYPVKYDDTGKIDIGVEYGYIDNNITGTICLLFIFILFSSYAIIFLIETLISIIRKFVNKNKK